jgi:hypothetical protein
MLRSLDWNLINGISGLLTAIGTLSAVIVSLRLALRDTRIRMKVDAGIGKIFPEGIGYERMLQEPDFLIITVTNVGRRVFTVTGLFWKNRLMPGGVFQKPGERPLSAQVPARLQDGEQADFTVNLEALAANGPAEIRTQIPRPRQITVRFLRVVVRTTTGEFVHAPLRKELREWFLTFSQGK